MYIGPQAEPAIKALPVAMIIQSLNLLGQNTETLQKTIDTFISSNPLVDFVYPAISGEAFDCTQLAAPFRPTLADHLRQQLHMNRLEPKLLKICEFIADSLDDSGYLRERTEDLIRLLHTTPQLFQDALATVQSLEPCGVGARSLSECLRLQLETQEPASELAIEIVSHHLEELASGTLKLQGWNESEIAEACRLIRRLEPRPGREFNAETIIYIKPDILIELDEQNERPSVTLINQPLCPSISAQYHQFLKTDDLKQRNYIQSHLLYARSFISAIQERQKTLLRIADQAAINQKDYLLTGSSADLHTMSMSRLAEKTGLSRSTVSRAVSGKYVQFKRKVFPLRDLFTLGGSGEHSRDKILSRIKVLCDSRETIMSDAKIASLLAQEGICISRRTVNKYRNQYLESHSR